LVYDAKGVLLEETKLGNTFLLNGQIELQFVDFITSTGLQIKTDPGIVTVYFSFLLLMISVYVSFFSYSQIWVMESTNQMAVGGKSNRAVLFFQEEFRRIVNAVKNY
jgi:cytochrome c biogenesis protein